MSLTYSQMLPLGTILPNFSLINVMNNKTYSNKDLLSNQRNRPPFYQDI